MPFSRSEAALPAIHDNIGLARSFCAGLTLESFAADRKTLYATTRCLEIISEASRRLDPHFKDQHPLVPWRDIADAGNAYRHAYESLRTSRLWNAVYAGLAQLLSAVDDEIGRLGLTAE
jgi:uncharacterized protein with HEPN domain